MSSTVSPSPEAWRLAVERVIRAIPHARELGIEVCEVAPPWVRMRLPWSEDLLGDPQRGLIHGGVLSMMLDTLCGASVLCGLAEPEVCPTLDLRVDHYRPAVAGLALYGEARMVRATESMVFTEGTLWQDVEHESGRTVARGVGNFVRLGPRSTPAGFAAALFGPQTADEVPRP